MPASFDDTIFALSSGAPPAAIAAVRISGPRAAAVLVQLAGRLPQPRRATLATLRDRAGEPLDRALLLWFPGPATATGEDLAELHLHGGRAVIAAVLRMLGGIDGCRLAEAGEFTRRAFAHGRIDLLESEGLADLLQAETEGERRRALHAAEGGLSRVIERWRDRLLMLAARAEALIEFGDDDDDVGSDPRLAADIGAFAIELAAVLATPPAERLRDGIRIVVAGPPNSGKSTLVNRLAGREAAIATPIAGTTRDLIEVPIVLDGTAVVLVDSAGLRESDDPIEREGIRRANTAIDRADLLLWLGSSVDAPTHDERIIVRTMIDLRESPADGGEDVAISVRTGAGVADLLALIRRRMERLLPSVAGATLLERQRRHVSRCHAHLAAAVLVGDEVLVAEELRQAMVELDVLQGRTGVEDMLDALFGRFCIGK